MNPFCLLRVAGLWITHSGKPRFRNGRLFILFISTFLRNIDFTIGLLNIPQNMPDTLTSCIIVPANLGLSAHSAGFGITTSLSLNGIR